MKDSPTPSLNKIPELFLLFSHKDISLLSDRTYQTLNKGFRGICHEIIKNEVESFLLRLNIPERYKQSLRDRISPQIASGTKYYVEAVSKGSYEIVVMLSALATFLLAATLGEDIKKAWQNTNASKRFRQMMGGDITKTDARNMIGDLQDYNRTRSNIIADQIVRTYESRVIEKRFIINEINIEKQEDRIEVKFDIKTIVEIEEKIVLEKLDSSNVDESIRKLLTALKK